jgi:hypothetical protein
LPREQRLESALVERIVASLDAAGSYPDRDPVRNASSLALPDGSSVGPTFRAWAAFDNRYPTLRSAWRGEQPIADAEGRLLLVPMLDVFTEVHVTDVEEELEDDEETLSYLRELAAKHAERWPGWGVRLESSASQDRILWMRPSMEPLILRAEDDEVWEDEAFDAFLADAFEAE